MIPLTDPPVEFAEALAFLQEASRDREPMTGPQIRVYYRLLGDIPIADLEAAVQRLAATHEYPTVPTPAAIRRAVIDLRQPERSGPEAWRLVQSAVRGYGLDGVAKGLASLPPAVARAAECFGWRALCDSKDSELTQVRFLKVYESSVASERREACLPPALRSGALAAANGKPGQLPPALAGIVGQIGRPATKEVGSP